MRKHLGNIAARFMDSLGRYDVRRRLPEPRGKRLLILMYHDLASDESRALGMNIPEELPTAAQLAAHISEARRRFRLIALRDAVAEINEGGLREDTVCVTFDDGYASVHSVALPVLKRFDVPATLFVLTGWINREVEFWWNQVRAIIATAPFDGVSSADIQRVLNFPVPRLKASAKPGQRFRVALSRCVEDNLRDVEDSARDDAIDRLRGLLLHDKMEILSQHNALSWDQVAELEQNGFELAAHTNTHINLKYADRDTVRRELIASREVLQRHAHKPVVGFAYPYGKDLDHYRHSEDLLRKMGFEYACSAFPGYNSNDSNLLALRRVSPPLTTTPARINRAFFHWFVRDNAFYANAAVSLPAARTRSTGG